MADIDDLDIAIYRDAAELTEVTVDEALEEIRIGLEERGIFHLALTGGTIGIAIAKEIAKYVSTGEWPGLHIWWSDERFVDLNSEERNDLEVAKLINAESGVTLHRAAGSGDINVAAENLENEIHNIEMDLNILGVGPDGHIASLFPNAIHEDEKREVFAITNSPKPPAQRITFSLQKINSSKEIWVIASGESKADAIQGFIEGEMNLPVSHVNATRLLVDAAAFGVDSE